MNELRCGTCGQLDKDDYIEEGYLAALDDVRNILKSAYDLYDPEDEYIISPQWFSNKLHELKDKQCFASKTKPSAEVKCISLSVTGR